MRHYGEVNQIRQIYTSASNASSGLKLENQIRTVEAARLRAGEVLVKNLFVPLHGSFWLASNPSVVHPRSEEFLAEGGFVFGNGGVAQVVESNCFDVNPGDYVAIFGHVPCLNIDCHGCKVLHRYTECDYGESLIIGHGKGAPDGTYADYTILRREAFEVCFREEESPEVQDLKPFMFAYLLADVRNALTRMEGASKNRRMLLVGGGLSGSIAAYLFLGSSPESRVFLLEPDPERIRLLEDFGEGNLRGMQLPAEVVEQLNSGAERVGFRNRLARFSEQLTLASVDFFGGKRANLVFDSSSGNSAPLWDNPVVLGPASLVIPFGFGSDYVLLSKELLQVSGLQFLTSRGVGNVRNRMESLDLIRTGAGSFLNSFLVEKSRALNGLCEALEFIEDFSGGERGSLVPHSYIEIP